MIVLPHYLIYIICLYIYIYICILMCSWFFFYVLKIRIFAPISRRVRSRSRMAKGFLTHAPYLRCSRLLPQARRNARRVCSTPLRFVAPALWPDERDQRLLRCKDSRGRLRLSASQGSEAMRQWPNCLEAGFRVLLGAKFLLPVCSLGSRI